VALGTTTHTVNQILYWGTGVATPVAEGTGISMSLPTDFAEDASWGDSFKTKKPGLTDFTMTVTKWYDHNEVALREAALSRTVGNWYWYPDRSVTTDYLFGTGYMTLSSIDAGGLNAIISNQYTLVAATQPAWRPVA
jgi:hypothetical protein